MRRDRRSSKSLSRKQIELATRDVGGLDALLKNIKKDNKHIRRPIYSAIL